MTIEKKPAICAVEALRVTTLTRKRVADVENLLSAIQLAHVTGSRDAMNALLVQAQDAVAAAYDKLAAFCDTLEDTIRRRKTQPSPYRYGNAYPLGRMVRATPPAPE